MSDVLKVGVDAARKAMPEVPIAEKSHPKGNAGVAQSVHEVNAKILEGAKDPRLREWAGQALKKAGDPTSTVDRAQALLDAQRAQTVYVQDPPGVELVQKATMTLCLEGDRGLCLRAGDCDDLVVVYCSAAMSLGISAKTVIEAYKSSDVYQHILCAIYDDDGEQWLKVDPSHRTWPVGTSSPYATKEKWFDPMDKAKVTLTPAGEFVGVGQLGAPPKSTLGPRGLGLVHRVAAGETPMAIAKRYTGDGARYGELVLANPHKPHKHVTLPACDGSRPFPTFASLDEGEELALPESWRAVGVGGFSIDRFERGLYERRANLFTPTCERCRYFAWHTPAFETGLVDGRDGKTHHPSCALAHVRVDCRGCGRVLGGCRCSRPTKIRLALCPSCAASSPR